MQEKFFARFGTINSLNTLANTCTEASRMRLFLHRFKPAPQFHDVSNTIPC